MATELTELADLANDNLLRERGNESLQTSLDDWTERLEVEAALSVAVSEIDIPSEPRRYVDVVSFGEHAVLGFLVKVGQADERTIFS